jgi:hypothetical protein
MKIQFKMDGGFASIPGLSKPLTIDTDQLPETTEKERVESLIQAANFFGPMPTTVASPGRADHRQYTITIEKDGRQHTVQLADPIKDLHYQELVDYLRERARASLLSS